MSDLFEVRDYHYGADLTEYRDWWARAIEIIDRRFDVLGLWFDSGIPSRISGAKPMDPPHGSANVTWVIRWDDLDQRESAWDELWSDDEWLTCWEEHPGFEHYLHMSVRFMEGL